MALFVITQLRVFPSSNHHFHVDIYHGIRIETCMMMVCIRFAWGKKDTARVPIARVFILSWLRHLCRSYTGLIQPQNGGYPFLYDARVACTWAQYPERWGMGDHSFISFHWHLVTPNVYLISPKSSHEGLWFWRSIANPITFEET